MFDVLDENNFILYAAKCYNSAGSTIEEFEDDLKRFSYLKRLLHRFHVDDILRERLILNHIIIIFNSFGIEGGLRMCFYKVDRAYWSYLKTFLVFLNYLDNSSLVEIPIDYEIKKALEAL